MAIAFLNGLPEGIAAATIHEAVRSRDPAAARHDLRHERFAPCVGCFECWTHHPGLCRAHDAANEVMPHIIGADVVVFATKLRFGCWDPITKVALDKSIGLISPFFTTVHGETHHRPRYSRYPRWAVVAETSPGTTEAEKHCFRRLVARNSLNLQHTSPFVGFVPEGADVPTVRAVIEEGLSTMAHEPVAEFPALAPFVHPTGAVGVPRRDARPRRALLWVGSAKPRGTSTSEQLGRFLLDELDAKGWECRTVHVAHAVKLGRAGSPELVEAIREVDLVVLASPVYVDCLPSLVLAGLAHMADAQLASPRPALLPIVQCGFPELSHDVLALEIAAFAAAEAGMPWAGHLALGGGGTIAGRPLRDAGGSASHQRNALQAAALALDEGRPLTAEITDEFAKSPLPPSLYRLAGQVGWLGQALKSHALLDLWDRPFARAPERPHAPDEPTSPP